jgi:ADP-heptose:LPS heptosyltransferase
MRHEAQETLADIGCRDKYAVIHPGAGSLTKCWPLERFKELATGLRGRMQVIFVVGPAEMDWWGQAELESIGKQFPLLSAPRLDVLAGILAGASLYVGNDSGVSHLAAAVGAPTTAIFGPSSSTHFAPLGPRVHIAPFTSSPAALDYWP